MIHDREQAIIGWASDAQRSLADTIEAAIKYNEAGMKENLDDAVEYIREAQKQLDG